jgi:hypothetical protein
MRGTTIRPRWWRRITGTTPIAQRRSGKIKCPPPSERGSAGRERRKASRGGPRKLMPPAPRPADVRSQAREHHRSQQVTWAHSGRQTNMPRSGRRAWCHVQCQSYYGTSGSVRSGHATDYRRMLRPPGRLSPPSRPARRPEQLLSACLDILVFLSTLKFRASSRCNIPDIRGYAAHTHRLWFVVANSGSGTDVSEHRSRVDVKQQCVRRAAIHRQTRPKETAGVQRKLTSRMKPALGPFRSFEPLPRHVSLPPDCIRLETSV